jgi:hypothetical protein
LVDRVLPGKRRVNPSKPAIASNPVTIEDSGILLAVCSANTASVGEIVLFWLATLFVDKERLLEAIVFRLIVAPIHEKNGATRTDAIVSP